MRCRVIIHVVYIYAPSDARVCTYLSIQTARRVGRKTSCSSAKHIRFDTLTDRERRWTQRARAITHSLHKYRLRAQHPTYYMFAFAQVALKTLFVCIYWYTFLITNCPGNCKYVNAYGISSFTTWMCTHYKHIFKTRHTL